VGEEGEHLKGVVDPLDELASRDEESSFHDTDRFTHFVEKKLKKL